MAVKAALKENSYGNRTRVKTGRVRLSYPHLLEKYEKSDKYQAQFLIDKEDAETVRVIEAAVKNAKEDGKTRLWGGKMPGKVVVAMKDGDERDDPDSYAEQAGCLVVTAKSKNQPPVLGPDGGDIFDTDEIYAGCYVQAIFEAYPYSQDTKGVAFALQGVKKLADGERIGGGGYKASADDFDADDDVLDDF